MQFPVWIEVGSLRLHPHMVFETLAYAVGFVMFLRRRRARGDHISDEMRWSVVTAAAVGSLIGSHFLNWFAFDESGFAGKTLVGGVLGGWLAVELEKRRIGIRERTGDLFVVPIAVGIAVGRIGCFLSGLPDGTYGVETGLPWGVDLGDGIARHPTALYESLFMAAMAIVFVVVERRLPRGALFRLFVASYLLFRVFVDMVKPGEPLAWNLTSIQWACVAGVAIVARRLIIDAGNKAAQARSVVDHS